MASTSNIYESDKLLAEYLLFHYGQPDEVLPDGGGPREALDFTVRCVSQCLDISRLPPNARALDLGCAAGRSSFELARACVEVIGIDFSRRFIEAAATLRETGTLDFARIDEGDLATPCRAGVPPGVAASRVQFEVGDAMDLRPDLGSFDVVLMANLIDRLREPQRCLARLSALVRAGGQLIITSPYTWLEDYTPRAHWLGGFLRDGERVSTFDGLRAALDRDFEFIDRKNLPFLIREHGRKFQWSVAEASLWRRRE